jgi:hypothetical protein
MKTTSTTVVLLGICEINETSDPVGIFKNSEQCQAFISEYNANKEHLDNAWSECAKEAMNTHPYSLNEPRETRFPKIEAFNALRNALMLERTGMTLQEYSEATRFNSWEIKTIPVFSD